MESAGLCDEIAALNILLAVSSNQQISDLCEVGQRERQESERRGPAQVI